MADDYEAAYRELFQGSHADRDWHTKVSPQAKELIGSEDDHDLGIPFPYKSPEGNEQVLQKIGPEKAIAAIDALNSHLQKRQAKQDKTNAEITQGTIDRNNKKKADILARQGF